MCTGGRYSKFDALGLKNEAQDQVILGVAVDPLSKKPVKREREKTNMFSKATNSRSIPASLQRTPCQIDYSLPHCAARMLWREPTHTIRC
jgi:hypothetical protein